AFTGANAKSIKKSLWKIQCLRWILYDTNIELLENEKLFRHGIFSEDGWPDDMFLCTFLLEQTGNKTKLIFLQTGVPEHKVTALTSGWKDYYWKPLKEYLNPPL
ncbi:MAG: SRPBCC domain-containing protein, partial [Bacteroidetes bacterium]|nr:SRPBCC domain-containing protein [Bacteroidota bacterium]